MRVLSCSVVHGEQVIGEHEAVVGHGQRVGLRGGARGGERLEALHEVVGEGAEETAGREAGGSSRSRGKAP